MGDTPRHVRTSVRRSTKVEQSRVAAAIVVAGVMLLVLTVVALRTGNGVPLHDVSRHVQSHITSLARSGGDDTDPIWIYFITDRDIRIRPDGSGQIDERLVERRFPTPREEDQWRRAHGGPLSDPIATSVPGGATFAPGELFYYKANDVRAGVTDVTLKLAAAGDALRRIASLLAETNPGTTVTSAALDTALGLNNVKVERDGNRVSISGVSGDGSTEITLVFEESPTRLAEERWVSQVPRPGLQLSPPYLDFDREILASEDLGSY